LSGNLKGCLHRKVAPPPDRVASCQPSGARAEADGERPPSSVYNQPVTLARVAGALLLVLSTQFATAQTSPKAGMLKQEAWAALDTGMAQVTE
jgi:hypothetical protein